MTGIVEIEELLKSMSPEIRGGEYAFCTVGGELADYVHLNPLATYIEAEGLTLILAVETAEKANIPYEGKYKQITLTVHSSLEAVGLTAAVAAKLTAYNISANVVAAFYHDHIFVQSEKADEAITALKELAK
ncbi:ACT domain-containing protein [uncultured Cocleimonas sp.]|uniref:ACT domain-containing protein n=1 Tax=uncultured Cocleimonas sp. TaxID=1051587 RepID=UPI00261B8E02|nr:ACT domain-containing protein [uncultured Cocleimonas sp.]